MSTTMADIKKCVLHTYKRSEVKKDIYKCVAPHCYHYINKDFLEGKECFCPKCHKPFILTKQHLKNKVPVCLMCSKSPKKHEMTAVASTLDDILKELNNPFKKEEDK